MSNTYIGHSTMIKCKCGYADVKNGFKDGCPYCGAKLNLKGSEKNVLDK